MYGFLYFCIGVLSNIDDVPVLFSLEERFDVFFVNIVTVLIGATWATRFLFGFFVDWYIDISGQYSLLITAIAASGLISWVWLACDPHLHHEGFVLLLVFGEFTVCNLKTVVDAMCASERSDQQMIRAVRFRLYGRIVGRTLGASVSWLATYRAAFVLIAILYGLLLIISVGCLPNMSPTYQSVQEETTGQSNVALLSLLTCLFWALPSSDRTQDLFYIQVLGYEERGFIYPILIADLISVISTIGKQMSAKQMGFYFVFCYMLVNVSRTLVASRVVPEFDSIFLVLAYSMWGVIEGKNSVATFVLVAQTNGERVSAMRTAFFDSVPVLAAGIGYAATLMLLHYLDLRQGNYTGIARFNLICTVVTFFVSIVAFLLIRFSKS